MSIKAVKEQPYEQPARPLKVKPPLPRPPSLEGAMVANRHTAAPQHTGKVYSPMAKPDKLSKGYVKHVEL
jgi:hypothetical protein